MNATFRSVGASLGDTPTDARASSFDPPATDVPTTARTSGLADEAFDLTTPHVVATSVVPEPASLPLLLAGAAALSVLAYALGRRF